MTTLAIDPTGIHAIHPDDVELTAREVTDLFVVCEKFGYGSPETAEHVIRFIAEVSLRDREIANAIVETYAEMGGSLPELVRQARRLRSTPTVGGYLKYLKLSLVEDSAPGNGERAKSIIRKAVERGCMWRGLSARETRKHLRLHNLDSDQRW